MTPQYQIILGGINLKESVRIGIYIFSDTRAHVYFSEDQIKKAIVVNKAIVVPRFRKTIEYIQYTVQKMVSSTKASSPYAFVATPDIHFSEMLNNQIRFTNPGNMRGNCDLDNLKNLVHKYVNANEKFVDESYEKKFQKAREHPFKSWHTYLAQGCLLDKSFFLWLTDEVMIDYGGYNAEELVLIKFIDVMNRYKALKAELETIERLKTELRDLPDIEVKFFLVSTKPDGMFSREDTDNWSRVGCNDDYLDIDEIEKLHSYLKSKKIRPLKGIKIKGEFSVVEGEKVKNL